jgi:putative endonuclease
LLIARAPRAFARWCTPDDRELGEWGEEIAARYLRARGWRILGRRCATVFAEVDIVALDRSSIVCVEVKAGRIEPLPRPRALRGQDAQRDARVAMFADRDSSHDELAPGALRWRPGRRCDARRIARLRRAARWLAERSNVGARVRASDADRSSGKRARAHRAGSMAGVVRPSDAATARDERRYATAMRDARGHAAAARKVRATSFRVDLVEVLLPMATRRPRVMHHTDVRRPPA